MQQDKNLTEPEIRLATVCYFTISCGAVAKTVKKLSGEGLLDSSDRARLRATVVQVEGLLMGAGIPKSDIAHEYADVLIQQIRQAHEVAKKCTAIQKLIAEQAGVEAIDAAVAELVDAAVQIGRASKEAIAALAHRAVQVAMTAVLDEAVDETATRH
jgi:uncharacterized protein (DUF433 family)